MSAPTTTTGISDEVRDLANQEYQYGLVTDLDTDVAPRGLNEDIIRVISAKKNEPDWLLEWRLRAYWHWITLTKPTWQHAAYEPVDFQDIIYYADPRPKKQVASMDEVDPEMREMFDKLGISLGEQERLSGVAVDRMSDAARLQLGMF